MLIVTVELHSAIDGKTTTLGTVAIDNIGVLDEKGNRADYRIRSFAKGVHWKYELLAGRDPLRSGTVENHPRKSKPIWSLVHKALASLGYDK